MCDYTGDPCEYMGCDAHMWVGRFPVEYDFTSGPERSCMNCRQKVNTVCWTSKQLLQLSARVCERFTEHIWYPWAWGVGPFQ